MLILINMRANKISVLSMLIYIIRFNRISLSLLLFIMNHSLYLLGMSVFLVGRWLAVFVITHFLNIFY